MSTDNNSKENKNYGKFIPVVRLGRDLPIFLLLQVGSTHLTNVKCVKYKYT